MACRLLARPLRQVRLPHSSLSLRTAATFGSFQQQQWRTQRWFSSEPKAETPEPFKTSPKVQQLIDEICKLSIVETVELVDALKVKFNYVEQAVVAGVAAPAAAASDAAEAPKVEEKTHFTVKITGYTADGKIKLIKEVRALTDLGLKQAKELVDNVPSVIKENLPKEEAEALSKKLADLGATVELV